MARCTKIINPNTDDAKYVINIKQIAKFVVGLGDKVRWAGGRPGGQPLPCAPALLAGVRGRAAVLPLACGALPGQDCSWAPLHAVASACEPRPTVLLACCPPVPAPLPGGAH